MAESFFDNFAKWTRKAALAPALAMSLSYCSKSPIDPEPQPNISQTITLEKDVNIKVSITLDNTDANLRIYRNDETTPLITRTITDTNSSGADFEHVFTYSGDGITKGNYRFEIQSARNSELTRTNNISVPDYTPQIGQIDIDLNENSQITMTLPNIMDKNPEDNPLRYTGVRVADGTEKASASLNGNELTINGNDGKPGAYKIEIETTNNSGEKNVSSHNGIVYDLLDVNGYLEDNETHSRQQGIIRVYNLEEVLLGEIQVPFSGVFNQRFNYRISELTNDILIQAKLEDSSTGNYQCFTRTLKFPRGDVLEKIIRVVPENGLAEYDISCEDFYRHMAEVLTPDELKPETDALTWNPEILKWKEIPEIIISLQHWEGSSTGFFSQETAEQMKTRILDPNDIGAWFVGKITSDKVRITEIYSSGSDPLNNPENHSGKIVVYPSRTIAGLGPVSDYSGDRYIDFGRPIIGINNEGSVDTHTLVHETGHEIGFQGHAETLSRTMTFMRGDEIASSPHVPKPTDKKAARILNEETFIHGEGRGQNKLLMLKDILGVY